MSIIFKLAGPKENLNKWWNLIREQAGLNIEEPAPRTQAPAGKRGDRTITGFIDIGLIDGLCCR